MKRSEKLLVNTIVGILSQIVTIVCGFILPGAIITAYGSAANGLTSSIGQFLGFISLCDAGVGAVTQSALYKPLAEGDSYKISCIIKSSRKFYRIVAIILTIYVGFLCISYPSLTSQFDRTFVVLMIICLSINSFANYYFGITNSMLLHADQKSYIPLGLQSVTVIINTVFCLILIKAGASLLTVKFATAVIFLIRPAVMYFYVRKNYNIDRNVIYDTEPINQKWNGLAQHFASVIVDHTDTVVLTAFSTLENVSIYAVYYMIVSSLRSMIMSSLSGVQAAMGNMLSKKEYGELNSFFGQIEWGVHTIVMLIYAITGILIVPFVSIYTKNVSDANYNVPLFSALIVMAIGGYCLPLIYKSMVKAAGHYKQTQTASVIECFINVIASVLLVFKFGLVGVAIGTILSMGYRLLYHVWYIKHNIINRPYRPFIKQITVDIITVLCIVLLTCRISVNGSNYFGWVISAVIISVISAIVCLAVNYIFYKDNIIAIFKKIFKIKKIALIKK